MPEQVEVGVRAPDFRLQDQDGRERTLADFTGKGKPVVLFFYCIDWSPVCMPEMERLVDRYGDIRDLVELVGLSVDHRWSHRAYADSLGLEFPILADWGGETARRYGLWLEGYRIAERATVYLSAEGTVLDVDVNDDDVARDIGDLVEKVRKLASV